MKQIQFLIVLILLGFSLSGCFNPPVPECKIKTEYVYIEKPKVEIPQKPVANNYNGFQVNMNGEDYYVVSKYDAGIMTQNWESYKVWAETLYDLLK